MKLLLDYRQGAPQKLYRVPEQDSYEIGDTVECWADANPDADYWWRNLDTLETWNGHVLYASDALVGSSRMQCHANNTINGLQYTNDYFFNFTVNRKYRRSLGYRRFFGDPI